MATKPGLRNSDGWNEAKPRLIQRTAPLPKSVPITGSATKAAKAHRNPKTPIRRTCRGVIIEMTSAATRARPPKNAWRVT